MERKGPVVERELTERPIGLGLVSDEQVKMLSNFYEVQQFLKAQRVKAKEESERKARVKVAAASVKTATNPFADDVVKCSICLSALVNGDKVCKFECKHLLHEKCRTDFIKYKEDKNTMKCPQCRGDTEYFQVFKYESATVISDEEDSRPINRPSATGSESHTFYPWWENATTREHSYLGEPQLTQGNHGLLVDPGAWSNLVGSNWAQNMAKKALKSGHTPTQERMDNPMTVSGVGTGSNKADWRVTIPIALEEDDGNVHVHKFSAPAVDKEGSDLPALLGLRSMLSMRAVLEMTEGEEYLTFPGPGGYKIEWSPGTKRHKLRRANAGHLILPCDGFDKVTETKGVEVKAKVFVTDRNPLRWKHPRVYWHIRMCLHPRRRLG
jgi:hypothetical protein